MEVAGILAGLIFTTPGDAPLCVRRIARTVRPCLHQHPARLTKPVIMLTTPKHVLSKGSGFLTTCAMTSLLSSSSCSTLLSAVSHRLWISIPSL